MEKELETRPGQSLPDATTRWLMKKLNSHPIPTALCIAAVFFLSLLLALYVGGDKPNKIGGTMALEFFALFFAWGVSKDRRNKLIGNSKTLQQRHLREKIQRKAIH